MKHEEAEVIDSKQKFDLSKVPTLPPEGTERKEIEEKTEKLGLRLEELFDLLYFSGKNGLLVVLQGMDAAGKDGTIRHILKFSHAQSCRVASFKVPTEEELAHDFLWRCHKQTPGKGEIVIFNRSHYEDVGIVRVKEFVPEAVWKKRYGHIRAFEENLVDAGTVVVKFFLHITKEEQEERLLEREKDERAFWKLSVGDWKERELWDGYQEAYSDAIGECGAKDAPWIVVPADKKWWRNYVVTKALVEALEGYEKAWREQLEKVGAEAKAELAEFRAGKAE